MNVLQNYIIRMIVISYFITTHALVATPLVNIQTINPSIKVDLIYATPYNAVQVKLYDFSTCYLLENVAQALDRVQKKLTAQGLGLKVWDGYRPLAVQWELWNILPDPRYVTDPRKGGRHTRGTTVDLTLINLADNSELEMPTEFDSATERAWHATIEGISQEAIKNRSLLKAAMESEGFEPIACEWWHYDYKGWRDCPVLDIDAAELEKRK